jgi:hypothetical protein
MDRLKGRMEIYSGKARARTVCNTCTIEAISSFICNTKSLTRERKQTHAARQQQEMELQDCVGATMHVKCCDGGTCLAVCACECNVCEVRVLRMRAPPPTATPNSTPNKPSNKRKHMPQPRTPPKGGSASGGSCRSDGITHLLLLLGGYGMR